MEAVLLAANDRLSGGTQQAQESVFFVLDFASQPGSLMPVTNELVLNYLLEYDLKNFRSPYERDYLRTIYHKVKEQYLPRTVQAYRYELEQTHLDLVEDKIHPTVALDTFNTYWRSGLDSIWWPEQRYYFKILNYSAQVDNLNDRFNEAAESLKLAEKLAARRYGRQTLPFALQLNESAKIYTLTGQYSIAETSVSKAITIARQTVGRRSADYAYLLETQAELFIQTGRYEEATDLMTDIEAVRYSLGMNIEADELERLALLHYHKGHYVESLTLLDSVFTVLDRDNEASKRRLIRPYSLLARLQLANGNFTMAEISAAQALYAASSALSDTSLQYGRSLLIISEAYRQMGDNERALALANQSAELIVKKLGQDHLETAQAITAIALLEYMMGVPADSVRKQLEHAALITENAVGKEQPHYADRLKDLALLDIDQKKYTDALIRLEEAGKIITRSLGNKHIKQAEIQLLYGDLQRNTKEYRKARTAYDKARKLYEDAFDEKHPKYVVMLGRIAQVDYLRGNSKKAIKTLEKTTGLYLEFIEKFFPSLSEREKSKYWQLLRPDFELFDHIIIQEHKDKQKYLRKMMDASLATKSILFSASVKLRNSIAASDNKKIQELYHQWITNKEKMMSALALNTEDKKELDLRVNLLEAETELLEKDLNVASKDFAEAQDYKSITYKEVAKKLEKGELAVDIIRCRYFDGSFTDSVYYVALIIAHNGKITPVVMPEGNKLERQNISYYRNAIRYKVEDNISYEAFFAPIKAHLPDGAKVYISPDGVYNQINIETLKSPAGDFMLDKNTLVLMGNLRELPLSTPPKHIAKAQKKAERKRRRSGIPNLPAGYDAVLVGNPTYHLEDKYNSLPSLPGAEEEIRKLRMMMATRNWKPISFINAAATEEAIRGVTSPDVLHLATHGFFVNENKAARTMGSYGDLSQNPMMRTGLMLAGSGDALAKHGSEFYLQTGVLTAYEATNMNLDSTQLVVLSACETGRGTVETGEGVYGLQRAFQIAGASHVIMSLFKVSDAATQELMTTFYEFWMQGYSKREAFVKAKQQLKEKYPHPYYWGSFVMVGI